MTTKTTTYRSVSVDLSRNKESVGFVQLPHSDSRHHDVIDFEDSEGIYHYLSKFGKGEEVDFYECSGTCYCKDSFVGDRGDDELDFQQRRVSVPKMRKIIAYTVIGFSAIVGIVKFTEKPKLQLKEKCYKLMNEVCEEAFIDVDVGECVPIEEQVELGDEVTLKEVERIVCKGTCLPTGTTDPIKEEKIDCKQLSLSTVFNKETLKSLENTEFHHNYVECVEKMMKRQEKLNELDGEELGEYIRLSHNMMEQYILKGCFGLYVDGVHEFFANHFLGSFCLESGKNKKSSEDNNLEVTSGKNLYHCEGWGGQIESGISFHESKRMKMNPSIDCVIETVLEK